MYVLFKSSAGIDPVKSFLLKFKKSNFESFPNSLGIVPLNELPSIEQNICAEDIIYRLEKQTENDTSKRLLKEKMATGLLVKVHTQSTQAHTHTASIHSNEIELTQGKRYH